MEAFHLISGGHSEAMNICVIEAGTSKALCWGPRALGTDLRPCSLGPRVRDHHQPC